MQRPVRPPRGPAAAAFVALLAAACNSGGDGEPPWPDCSVTCEDTGQPPADAGPPDVGPCPSGWRPVGCRAVSPDVPALPPGTGWHNLHSDNLGSDEVGIVLGTDLVATWTAETDTFNVTGPVFDAAGNLYFAPLSPHEAVVLVSLDPATGTRRFAVPATTSGMPGAGTPVVLRDPSDASHEQIFVGLYDRALALETDGTVAWDVPTGLTVADGERGSPVFGLSYHPGSDGLVGLARDGSLYVLSRVDGAPLLAAPFELPGEPSPTGTTALTPALAEKVAAELAPLVALETSADPSLVDVLLGNGTEVANFFSIDPSTGTLWIAATAPDAEDGTEDGVSELGALYALELVPGDAGLEVRERCHASFEGGSASTPSLRRDGGRVYVADNGGRLLAIDTDCAVVWSYDVGSQIVGSVAVASDHGELYAATGTEIVALRDAGVEAALRFRVAPPGPAAEPREVSFNLNLVGIAENGLAFQSGVGRRLGEVTLPRAVGVGLLDRETGALRHYVEGLDETVAVMSVGPDGGLYLGNSPVRRAIHRAIYGADASEPLVGGISAFRPTPRDVAREALCAAGPRLDNAAGTLASCPESAADDVRRARQLLAQARAPGLPAVDAELDAAAARLDAGELAEARAAVERALSLLLE